MHRNAVSKQKSIPLIMASLITSVCVYCYFSYPACKLHLSYAALYCEVRPVLTLLIFHIMSKKIQFLEGELLNVKSVFRFYLQLLLETFLIPRRIVINVKSLHEKYPLFLQDFNKTWIFSTDFLKKTPQISSFTKIRLVGAEMFHARKTAGQTDGQTDGHDTS
jgi:hypothetical protein